jgi:hypothetical protein
MHKNEKICHCQATGGIASTERYVNASKRVAGPRGPQCVNIWFEPLVPLTIVRKLDHEWLVVYISVYHPVSPHLWDGVMLHALKFCSMTTAGCILFCRSLLRLLP